MSVTRDSSIDTGYASDSTGPDGSVETVVYVDIVQMELGSTPGEGEGSALIFSGDATAAGTDTYAQMLVEALAADNGSSSTLSLSADLIAAAAAEGFDPFAATTVWYVVVGPVDSYIQIEELETFTASGPDGTVTIQSASVDFDGVVLNDPMQCPDDPELPPCEDACAPQPDPGCDCGCDCGADDGDDTFTFEGNVAVFVVQADAIGDDSYASVTFDALTLEDALSTITGVVEVAIG